MAALDDDYDLPPGIEMPAASALPRCWPETDVITTEGERRGRTEICIDWANGRCPLGVKCEARHALPNQNDEIRLQHSADGVLCDIFGRPRASISTPLSSFDPLACTILHVASGVPMPEAQQRERQRIVDAGFGEWGTVVKTWFVADPKQCYVKFKSRATAQLVIEALHGRPLRPEDAEPLELAWCTVDPSIVQAQQGRELAYTAMREARERGRAAAELYERLEREKRDRESGVGGSGGLGIKRPRSGAVAEEASSSYSEWVESGGEPVNAVATAYPGVEPEAAASGEEPAASTTSLPPGWQAAIDPTYNVTYYYNEATGETQWEAPS